MRERMVGNFPQAFSHLALIGAAVTLGSMSFHLHRQPRADACRDGCRCCPPRPGWTTPRSRAPSLCEGWTRAHVVTHIARNADALSNLVHWATTGEPTPMYASPESRDADIAEGARRARGRPGRATSRRRPRASPRWRPCCTGHPRTARWSARRPGRARSGPADPAVGRGGSTTSTSTWASASPTRTPGFVERPCAARWPPGRCAGGAVAAPPQRRGRRLVGRRRATHVTGTRAVRCSGSPGVARTRSHRRLLAGRCPLGMTTDPRPARARGVRRSRTPGSLRPCARGRRHRARSGR